MDYLGLNETKNLKRNQLVICRCPHWNEEGYQVAVWNGKEFEYSGQQNDMFNGLVTAFIRLDDEGFPFG